MSRQSDEMMGAPRYPGIRVRIRSQNPLALVAAVREAMRVARIERDEIRRFSREALATESARSRRAVCRRWVQVEPRN